MKIPEYTPNLDHFVLAGKARPTDLLSVAVINGGFLISEKFKKILEQFKLPTHKFYPAKVKRRNELLDYYWMHMICNLTDNVDYPNSKFFVYQNFSTALGFIDINSKDDYFQKSEALKSNNPGKILAIWASQIVLPSSIVEHLDLFEIVKLNADTFISEGLRKAIKDEGITGCYITNAGKLQVSDKN